MRAPDDPAREAAESFALRASLAAAGWESQDRLGAHGWGERPGYSVWFSRYDWHGRFLGTAVTVHASDPDLAGAPAAVLRAGALAVRAWEEFPEAVPRVDARGRLVVDELATKFWRDARRADDPEIVARRKADDVLRALAPLAALLACRGCGARAESRKDSGIAARAIRHRLACPLDPPGGGEAPARWVPRALRRARVWVGLRPRHGAPGFAWEVATAPDTRGARLAYGDCMHGRRAAAAHALAAAAALAREAWDPSAGADARVACAERAPALLPGDGGPWVPAESRDVEEVFVCRTCGAEGLWREAVPHRLACEPPARARFEPREPAAWSPLAAGGRALHLGTRPAPLAGLAWEVATAPGLAGERVCEGLWRGGDGLRAHARRKALRARAEGEWPGAWGRGRGLAAFLGAGPFSPAASPPRAR